MREVIEGDDGGSDSAEYVQIATPSDKDVLEEDFAPLAPTTPSLAKRLTRASWALMSAPRWGREEVGIDQGKASLPDECREGCVGQCPEPDIKEGDDDMLIAAQLGKCTSIVGIGFAALFTCWTLRKCVLVFFLLLLLQIMYQKQSTNYQSDLCAVSTIN